MATPRRQPVPRPPPQTLHNLAAITYSLSHLPTRSHEPDDPNFPHLTPTHTPRHPPIWASPGKTTAAEVVATPPPETVTPDHTAESEKCQAELALLSKLVPTASAVPRNPRRSLGGGGLRSTGSVATLNKPSIAVPVPIAGLPRKQPLASRLRSLSSDTSRPQLARRVAHQVRSASATPPSPAEQPSDPEVENPLHPEPRDVHVRTRKVVVPTKKTSQHARLIDYARSRIPRDDKRREDSSNSVLRFDPSNSPSPVASRRSQVDAMRRSTVSPSNPSPRKGHARDVGDRHASKSADNSAVVPPGFEGRPSFVNRDAFRGRLRLEDGGKGAGGKSTPPRPVNARADAMRVALDSKRRSVSPRTSGFRRTSLGSVNGGTGAASGGRAGVMKIDEEVHSGKGHLETQGSRRSSLPGQETVVKARLSLQTVNSGSRPLSSPVGGESVISANKDYGSLLRKSVVHQPVMDEEARRVPDLSVRVAEKDVSKETSFCTSELSRDAVHGCLKGMKAISTGSLESAVTISSVLKSNSYDYGSDLRSVPTAGCGMEAYGDNSRMDFGVVERTIPGWNRNGWGDTMTDGGDVLRHRGAEGFSSEDLLGQKSDELRSQYSSPCNVADENSVACSTLLRGFNVMEQCLVESAALYTLSNVEKTEDVVLPPLPNSEDVGFEPMLRAMGWTPPDED